jgi:hypothetical protein
VFWVGDFPGNLKQCRVHIQADYYQVVTGKRFQPLTRAASKIENSPVANQSEGLDFPLPVRFTHPADSIRVGNRHSIEKRRIVATSRTCDGSQDPYQKAW